MLLSVVCIHINCSRCHEHGLATRCPSKDCRSGGSGDARASRGRRLDFTLSTRKESCRCPTTSVYSFSLIVICIIAAFGDFAQQHHSNGHRPLQLHPKHPSPSMCLFVPCKAKQSYVAFFLEASLVAAKKRDLAKSGGKCISFSMGRCHYCLIHFGAPCTACEAIAKLSS